MFENLPVCQEVIESQKRVALVVHQKGKGKGKGKSRYGYPLRPSYLTLEDRRKKLGKLKSESACRDCGKKGHWSGDPQCSHKKSAKEATDQVPYGNTLRLKENFEEARKACNNSDCECNPEEEK